MKTPDAIAFWTAVVLVLSAALILQLVFRFL